MKITIDLTADMAEGETLMDAAVWLRAIATSISTAGKDRTFAQIHVVASHDGFVLTIHTHHVVEVSDD